MKARSLVFVIGVMALGALLAACGGSTGGTGSTQGDASARATFIAERGNGTPGVMSDTMPFDAEAPGGMMPGVAGTVEKVDGKSITVKRLMDGSTSTIQLAEDAKVHKQDEGKLSDLKPGDSIVAFGSKDGTTLQTNVLQIGEGGDMMDGPGGGMRVAPPPGGLGRPGGSGTPGASSGEVVGPDGGPVIFEGAPGDGAMQGESPQAAFGKVESVEGSTITIKDDPNGTTTITVGDGTRIMKRVEVDPSEIKAGETIIATGSRDGDTFNATEVQIMSGDAMMFRRP